MSYAEAYNNAVAFRPRGEPCEKNGVRAAYAVAGGEPDGKGGGILSWHYSTSSAMNALKWYVENGYIKPVLCEATGDYKELFNPADIKQEKRVFGPDQLQQAIARRWGERGAHMEVFKMLLQRIEDCEKAGRDLLPILGKHGIAPPPSFVALDSPESWFNARYGK